MSDQNLPRRKLLKSAAGVLALTQLTAPAHAQTGTPLDLDLVDEFKGIVTAMQQIQAKLQPQHSQVGVVDMFDMQLTMNEVSQENEMDCAVMSSATSAMMSMARNIKS